MCPRIKDTFAEQTFSFEIMWEMVINVKNGKDLEKRGTRKGGKVSA